MSVRVKSGSLAQFPGESPSVEGKTGPPEKGSCRVMLIMYNNRFHSFSGGTMAIH